MVTPGPPRAAAPVAGTIVSASVEEVRWRAEPTHGNGTIGAATNGTNGTHANGTADAAAPEAPTTEAPVAGEPAANAISLPPSEVELPPGKPPKKKRWFRRNK